MAKGRFGEDVDRGDAIEESFPLFVVGLRRNPAQWELVGAFTTEEAAEERCDTPDHFIVLVTTDEPLKRGDGDFPTWAGIRYPRAGEPVPSCANCHQPRYLHFGREEFCSPSEPRDRTAKRWEAEATTSVR